MWAPQTFTYDWRLARVIAVRCGWMDEEEIWNSPPFWYKEPNLRVVVKGECGKRNSRGASNERSSQTGENK